MSQTPVAGLVLAVVVDQVCVAAVAVVEAPHLQVQEELQPEAAA